MRKLAEKKKEDNKKSKAKLKAENKAAELKESKKVK